MHEGSRWRRVRRLRGRLSFPPRKTRLHPWHHRTVIPIQIPDYERVPYRRAPPPPPMAPRPLRQKMAILSSSSPVVCNHHPTPSLLWKIKIVGRKSEVQSHPLQVIMGRNASRGRSNHPKIHQRKVDPLSIPCFISYRHPLLQWRNADGCRSHLRNYGPQQTPFDPDTTGPTQETAPNRETTTARPMCHRGRAKFRNGQVDHTQSAPPPRIRVSRVAPEVLIQALVTILQIELFTIPLKFHPPPLTLKSSTILDICIRILQSTTL